MRLCLIGDTQVDEHADLESQRGTLAFIAAEVARRQCDLLLHSGDVFERRSTPAERRVMAEFVQAVADVCPVAVVSGNHDQPEDVAWLSRLRGKHAIVAHERPCVETFGAVQVAYLPWPSTSALRAWVARPAGAEETDQLARDMLADVLRGLGADMDRSDCPRILLGHIMPAEGRSSTGQPIIGAELRLGDTELGLARAHLYAFGHLHNGALNEWTIDGRPALMPGSTRRRDFGEIETKRAVFFDLDAAGNVTHREDVELPCPQMFHVNATWSPLGALVFDEDSSLLGAMTKVAGASIRLRFECPAAEMAAAKAEAAKWAAAWRNAGAALVKIEATGKATTRARAPEIAAEPTTEGKLSRLHALRGEDADRSARLVALTRELCAAIPDTASRAACLGALRRLTIHGIGPFTGTATLDVAALPRGIVALIGANGEGKSTTLRCIDAAWGRPTRLAMGKRARLRDSYIEQHLDGPGGASLIRLTIDGISKDKKSEAFVADLAGQPLAALPSTSVKAYDEWCQAHAIPPDVYATTLSASQGTGGFIGLATAARRSIVLSALGISRLEQLAAAARARIGTCAAVASRLRERIADETPRADVEKAAHARSDAGIERSIFEGELTKARAALEDARARHAALLDAFRNAEAAAKARADALREVEHRRQIVRGIGLRLMAADAVLVDADAVRAARADELRLSGELRTAETAYADAKAAAQETRRAQETALAEKAAAEQRFTLADEPRKRVAEIESRESATARELADADAVAAAGARVAAIDAEIPTAEEALQTARVAAEECRADATAADRDLSEADRRLRDAESALFKARAACGDVESARTAGARAEVLRADVASAEDARAKAQAALDEMNEALHDVAGKRIVALHGFATATHDRAAAAVQAGSSATECGTMEVIRDAAADVLADDANAVAAAAEAPAKLEHARQVLSCATQIIVKVQGELRTAESLAARLPDLERAEVLRDEALAAQTAAVEAKRIATTTATAARTTRDAAVAAQERALAVVVRFRDERRVAAQTAARASEIAAFRARAEELVSQRVEASRALVAAEQQVEDARLDASVAFAEATTHAERLDVQRDELTTLLATVTTTTEALDLARRTAAREPEIAAAEATARELRAQQETAQTAVATAQAALDALPEPPASEPVPDVAAQERAVQDAEAALRRAEGAVALAEQALQNAQEAAGRVADLTSELALADRDVADWTMLAADLGQRGLIALEVDAVGPELAATANALLRSGFGARWTLNIETTRPKADGDGDGDVECCDVNVIDGHTGYSGPVDELSGGEAVVVSEAIRMALTLVAIRRMGLVTPTLLRDEPGAALSPELPIPGCDSSAPATEQHLRMLREAARISGGTVLLVSHDPGIPRLCDARVRVAGGAFVVEAA